MKLNRKINEIDLTLKTTVKELNKIKSRVSSLENYIVLPYHRPSLSKLQGI